MVKGERQSGQLVRKVDVEPKLFVQLAVRGNTARVARNRASSDCNILHAGPALLKRLALLYQHLALCVKDTNMYH